ncbi:MAG: type II toxin-antitoxin system RelE/ParE family toxin [Parachlamydia sp.]|nr:type II toxin-antitoxin system RelE/ParE family toxin [Parachlamydia sp.]
MKTTRSRREARRQDAHDHQRQARVLPAFSKRSKKPLCPWETIQDLKGQIKLKGSENLFRIRVGPYRIIYTIQDDKLIVLVLEIGDRKDIYKGY